MEEVKKVNLSTKKPNPLVIKREHIVTPNKKIDQSIYEKLNEPITLNGKVPVILPKEPPPKPDPIQLAIEKAEAAALRDQ